MDNIWIALIAVIPAIAVGVGAPALTVWLQNIGKQKEKEQEWERQDEVANRAAEASRKLLASQEAARDAMQSAARATNLARQETYSQLSAIHTLVNSNMTAALQAELDSTKRELTALREIMELKAASGQEPSIAALAVIETAERRIAELDALLAERQRKDELAKAQIEGGQTAGRIADAAVIAAKPAAEEAARKIVPPVVTEVVPPVVKAAVKEALVEHDKAK